MEGIVRAQTPSSSLISLADARLALAQATDVGAVAMLVDRLEVVRLAARKARLSLEAQNDWATLKLEAERKAGGMLTELRRAGELHAWPGIGGITSQTSPEHDFEQSAEVVENQPDLDQDQERSATAPNGRRGPGYELERDAPQDRQKGRTDLVQRRSR